MSMHSRMNVYGVAITAVLFLVAARALGSDWYVSESNQNKVVASNGWQLTGLNNPKGLATGPDGALYIADSLNNQVVRFDFVTNGRTVVIAGSPLLHPAALAFAPSGDLYVSSQWNNKVLVYSNGGPAGFTLRREIVVEAPSGIAFDGAGDFYVSSFIMGGGTVWKYDSNDNLLGSVAPAPQGTLNGPAGLAISPYDGLLYVCSYFNGGGAGEIQKYGTDPANPQYLGTFVDSGTSGSLGPIRLAFRDVAGIPRLFVTCQANNCLVRFDVVGCGSSNGCSGTNGVQLRTGLQGVSGLTFLCSPAIDQCQGVDGESVVAVNGNTGAESSHVVVADHLSPITFDIMKPSGGGRGKFIATLNEGVPTMDTITPLPAGLGSFCFPLLLQSGASPVASWNNLGRPQKLGVSHYFDDKIPDPARAPTSFANWSGGEVDPVLMGTYWTLQAIILNPVSSSPKGASVTNAILVAIQ